MVVIIYLFILILFFFSIGNMYICGGFNQKRLSDVFYYSIALHSWMEEKHKMKDVSKEFYYYQPRQVFFFSLFYLVVYLFTFFLFVCLINFFFFLYVEPYEGFRSSYRKSPKVIYIYISLIFFF
jgi:hypothetical protein